MKTISTLAGMVVLLVAEATALPTQQPQPLAPALSVVAQTEEALRNNDQKNALRIVQEGIVRFPRNEDLQVELARVYVYGKHDKKAVELLQGIIRKNPASRGSRLQLAEIYGYHNQYQKSDQIYRELLAADPSDEAAALGLIHNLALEGKSAEARQLTQQSLAQHPASLGLQEYNDYLSTERHASETAQRPRLARVAGSFFSDNAGNRSLYSSQHLMYGLPHNFSTSFAVEETSLWVLGTPKANMLSWNEELRARLARFVAVRAAGGSVRFADTSSRALFSGDLDLQPWKGLLLTGGYSRFPLAPTFDAAVFDLSGEGWHTRLEYHTRNFFLRGGFSRTNYSDGNRGESEYAETMRWVGTNAFALGGGYAFRHLHFIEDPLHGYFSPAQYRSHLASAGIRVQIGRVYRGEYLGYGGIELEGVNYTPAGEVRLQNQFFLHRWELDANYSRYQLIQSTGAFQANSGSFALGYRF